MDLEFRELQYFLAVVREENITRAAESLHITQPTLSRQMTLLEEKLGAKLFVRGKYLSLTDAGMMLRRRAEEASALMDNIQRDFQEDEELAGRISIGMGGLHAFRELARAMDSFKKLYPRVDFSCHTNNADYIKEQIDQGILDFGLLLEPVDISRYSIIRMEEKEIWGLFMRRDHPLAAKEKICSSDLHTCRLIVSARESVNRQLEMWLGAKMSSLDIFAVYNIITNVATLVEDGLAAALTIRGAVECMEGDKMVFRPLEPELSMTSVLAWKKIQPGLGVAGKFLQHVKDMRK